MPKYGFMPRRGDPARLRRPRFEPDMYPSLTRQNRWFTLTPMAEEGTPAPDNDRPQQKSRWRRALATFGLLISWSGMVNHSEAANSPPAPPSGPQPVNVMAGDSPSSPWAKVANFAKHIGEPVSSGLADVLTKKRRDEQQQEENARAAAAQKYAAHGSPPEALSQAQAEER